MAQVLQRHVQKKIADETVPVALVASLDSFFSGIMTMVGFPIVVFGA